MRMEQRMKLAPRMIQSMEILQLPLMALEERIEKELEANPVLERRESDFEAPDTTGVAGIPKEAVLPAADANSQTAAAEDTAKAEISDREIEQYLKDQSDFSSLNRISRKGSGERDAKMDAMANTAARGASLQEELTSQWDLVDVEDRIRRAGYVLIDWVADDGYIRDPIEKIAEHLPSGLTQQDILDAIPIMQTRLEPVGICARNVQECLLLQIDAWEPRQEL